MKSWAEEAIFYHIYPLGFCGAPESNNEALPISHSLIKVVDWIPHLKSLGINAIYFGPLFQSVKHGYDTIDYCEIDRRLGSDEDFKMIVSKLHEADIKVVVDGVFNHVGRDFFAFKDLRQNKEASLYKDWFINVNFNNDSPYQDGYSYEGWEGHFNLVKLNLKNQEVRNYLFGAVYKWMNEFDIDGIRLDVAYCIDEDFLVALRSYTDEVAKKMSKDFWLMGEMIHGDYSRLLKENMLHSVTDYECYKGIYSSHNDKNYFEINHSMNRLFAKGGLYEGSHLYSFVDNHDVNRIASTLVEPKCINNVYTLLFTMPGIPSIYYGGEWQVTGKKENGNDAALRPCLDLQEMLTGNQDLVKHIQKLAAIKKQYEILHTGLYEQLVVRNEQLIFARNDQGKRIVVALNLVGEAIDMSFKAQEGENSFVDVLSGKEKILNVTKGECKIHLLPYSAMILVKHS